MFILERFSLWSGSRAGWAVFVFFLLGNTPKGVHRGDSREGQVGLIKYCDMLLELIVILIAVVGIQILCRILFLSKFWRRLWDKN
jgi:hypothetical protein